MLLAFLAYLPCHLLAYVLLVRHLAWFRREAGIFLYHAVPAAAASACCLALLLVEPTAAHACEAVLAISLQGIYSMSFLELWSLTEGGYSLHMLARFWAAGGTATAADLALLEGLGSGKRSARLAGLLRLALVWADGDRVRLTGRGRVVAGLLRGVAWAVNHKHLG
jgi:hypothetical protein